MDPSRGLECTKGTKKSPPTVYDRFRRDPYLRGKINARRNYQKSVISDKNSEKQILPTLRDAQLTKYLNNSDAYELIIQQQPVVFDVLDPEKQARLNETR